MPVHSSIAEIDELIDASYKRKDIPAEERAAVREHLRNVRARLIAELDIRPKLKTATEILAEMTKPRKKFRKAQFGDERVVVCGSTDWTDKGKIRAALKTLSAKDTRFVIIGTSKGAEQLAIPIAKELKLPVVQVHPQQHLGNSAVHIRNHEVFKFFKPTRVIAFHNDIEASTSTKLFMKLGSKLDIPTTLVTKQDTTKSIAKKMKVVHE